MRSIISRRQKGRPWAAFFVCAALLLAALAPPGHAQERALRPAFGPYTNPAPADFRDAASFRSDQRLIGTYYFYWYDIHTRAHLVNGDGSDALTTHPPTLEDFSYTSVRWHRRQLEDMAAAGIDFVLPVFWGTPADQPTAARLHWSFAGLAPLVAARDELLREGKRAPPVGLFYDTTTLRINPLRYHADLTTDDGRRWFYATIRDFFSVIPARHWAMIDGRPIVFLYLSEYARAYDQGAIEHVRREFAREFGGRTPWIAREQSWRVSADATYAWGGAVALRRLEIASLGPGYDHSAVKSRAPYVVERRGGAFYEESWSQLLRRPSRIVMIETWNEFHEGTDIAESREYGRRYIELTRKYAGLFKSGAALPPPRGRYTGAESVSVALGRQNREEGLRYIDQPDGETRPATLEGRSARLAEAGIGGHRYAYFAVDDTFKSAEPRDYTLEVDYFDAAPGQLGVQFDGGDLGAPFNGAYTSAASIALLGDRRWKRARFVLKGARFLNSQNGGADLRLVVSNATMIAIERLKLQR